MNAKKYYRIDEEWGGGEGYETPMDDVPDGWISISRREAGWIGIFHKNALTPVAPPLPEEPPVWSVVSCYDGESPWTFQREPVDDKHFWFTTGQERGFSWEEVCSKGRPVLLTPEPAKVELPWTDGPFAVAIRDGGPQACSVVLTHTFRDANMVMTPSRARRMAAALLTAAGEP